MILTIFIVWFIVGGLPFYLGVLVFRRIETSKTNPNFHFFYPTKPYIDSGSWCLFFFIGLIPGFNFFCSIFIVIFLLVDGLEKLSHSLSKLFAKMDKKLND